jgi:hypothetical protein
VYQLSDNSSVCLIFISVHFFKYFNYGFRVLVLKILKVDPQLLLFLSFGKPAEVMHQYHFRHFSKSKHKQKAHEKI